MYANRKACFFSSIPPWTTRRGGILAPPMIAVVYDLFSLHFSAFLGVSRRFSARTVSARQKGRQTAIFHPCGVPQNRFCRQFSLSSGVFLSYSVWNPNFSHSIRPFSTRKRALAQRFCRDSLKNRFFHPRSGRQMLQKSSFGVLFGDLKTISRTSGLSGTACPASESPGPAPAGHSVSAVPASHNASR